MGDMQRFWSRVDKSGDCWLWMGYRDRRGYGTMYDPRPDTRRYVRVHRLAYELQSGPIPAGLTIDHLCRNTSCVNPAHLEAVTSGVNVLRGDNPPARNARKTHCVNGHPFNEVNTWVDRRNKRYCRPCHRAYVKARYWRKVRSAQRPAPDPDCRYCSGRGWVVGGDEVRDCYCRGLVATDLTEDNSALRGQRDALRHELVGE